MNTLIKIIITTVIGFFGTLSHEEDVQVNLQGAFPQEIEIDYHEENYPGPCYFEENLFKTLKNKIPS